MPPTAKAVKAMAKKGHSNNVSSPGMSSRSSVAPTNTDARAAATKVSIRRTGTPTFFVMSSPKPPANAGMAESASIVSPWADLRSSQSNACSASTLPANAAAIATPPIRGVGAV